jgi:putative transposase
VAGDLIGHSDAGSQYTAVHNAERLEGLKPSIGSVGDAYDNAAHYATLTREPQPL